VGHPLTKIISDYKTMDLRKTHEINRSDTLISLFPASRISQFRRFTPMLCKAAFMIERKLSQSGIGCRFMIGLSDNISGYKYRKYITNPKIIEVSGKGYDLMSCSDIVISTCGTTTLEATLFERPMVAFYRINPILARFLRGLFKFSVKYYSLPNLLAGKEVVPELIQERATPENIADAATSVILDGKIHRIKQDLANIKKYLGNINTFDRMADELLKYL
jgi:lipid-A-disaccharide synthase